jgi:hypothetical protein
VRGNPANLRPWPKGISGNPGGRPKKQPITGELERLLAGQAANRTGETWATVIAEGLLQQASRGDVRAISELINRVEGKPLQAFSVTSDAWEGLTLPVEGQPCSGKRFRSIHCRELDFYAGRASAKILTLKKDPSSPW